VARWEQRAGDFVRVNANCGALAEEGPPKQNDEEGRKTGARPQDHFPSQEDSLVQEDWRAKTAADTRPKKKNQKKKKKKKKREKKKKKKNRGSLLTHSRDEKIYFAAL